MGSHAVNAGELMLEKIGECVVGIYKCTLIYFRENKHEQGMGFISKPVHETM